MGSSCSLQSGSSESPERHSFALVRNRLGTRGDGDGEPSRHSSLRYAVVTAIPDRYIPSFYPEAEGTIEEPDGTRSPKSLTELATEAFCRSLVYANGPLPQDIPHDVVETVLDSLYRRKAITSSTLAAFRVNELTKLHLDQCRGVTDTWLTKLTQEHDSEGSTGGVPSVETAESPNLSSSEEGSNPVDILESPLQLGPRQLTVDGYLPSPDSPCQPLYLDSSSSLSETSTASFLSASSSEKGMKLTRVPLVPSVALQFKPSTLNEAIVHGSDHDPMADDEDDDIIMFDAKLPAVSVAPSPKSTRYIRSLNLSRSQGVTDAGLLKLGNLRFLEDICLDHCHSITGGGLAIMSHSFQLRNASFAQCRRLSDEGVYHISHLIGLESLNLSGCRCLSLVAMSSLNDLYSLQKLDLSFCDAMVSDDGITSLARLEKLGYLDLGWCPHLTDVGIGILCAQTGRSERLRYLRLARTRIVDPSFLLNLKSLEELNLNGCTSLESSRLSLKSLTNLHTLDLSHIPSIIRTGWQGQITNVKSLNLSCSSVRDSHIGKLTSLPALEEINLDSCPVGDWAMAHIVDNEVAPNLKSIDLADSNITDSGLSKLCKLTSLTKLSLFYCNVSNQGLQNIGDLTNLEELNLDSREISDEGLVFLSKLSKLRSLDIFSGRITNKGCSIISELSCLETLELCGGGVGDAGCFSLSKLVNLRKLNLSQNEGITNRGAGAFAALVNLEHLNLSSTGVSTSVLRSLVGLSELSMLSLYGCRGMEYSRRIDWFKMRVPTLKCLRLSSVPATEGMFFSDDTDDDSLGMVSI